MTVRVSWIGKSCRGLPVEDIAVGDTTMVEVPAGVRIGGGVVVTMLVPAPHPAA